MSRLPFFRAEAPTPLGASALLTTLTRRELRVVESFMHRRDYLPGEVVFDQGEEGQALYIVLSGAVHICLPGGPAEPLARLAPGDFFGEMALIDNWPRSAQAIAAAPTTLAALFRGDFERLMAAQAGIGSKISMQLARHLAQRLRDQLARQSGN